MSVSGAATARWGTACASCAFAKSRCIRSTDTSGKCERCRTLRKDCTGQVHKVRKKRQPKPSRTALLEEKLDSLVDLLKATPGGTFDIQSILSSPASSENKSTEPDKTLEARSKTPEQLQTVDNEFIHNEFPSKFTSVAPPTCICRAPVSEEDSLPADKDDVLLSIYVNQLCAWFPFVILSPNTTPASLQSTRPFLLKCIRLVASLRNVRSMWGQRRAIMQYLSEAVFVRSERTLDILQGVLVLLGFYHCHCLVHIQFNSLMQLAVSLAGDLDLNRDPTRQPKLRVMTGYEELKARSNEERRAFLGVWYMSSNVALTFNKGQSEKYTRYHSQCLDELERAAEYESDLLLVQVIRIQHLTQRIVDCNNRDQLPDELPGIVDMPASAYYAAFRIELERLRNEVHPSLKSNYLITNHFNTTLLRLHEPLLQDSHLLDAVSRSFTTLSLSDPTTHERFSACHAALKTWFDHWLTIPVCFYFYMSQPLSAQLICSMMMLSRWALLFCCSENDDDNNSAASLAIVASSDTSIIGNLPTCITTTQIPILDILEKTAIRFEAAKDEMSAAQGGVWKNGLWDLAAKKMRAKKKQFEKWWMTVRIVGGEGKYKIEIDELNLGLGVGVDGGLLFDPSFGGMAWDDSWLCDGDLFDGLEGGFFDIPPAVT